MLLRISLPLHGALEFVAGFAIAAVPAALGADPLAAAVGIAIGLVVMGAASQATMSDTPGERFSVQWHKAFDRGVALLLVVLGLVLILAGDSLAGVIFLGSAAVLVTLMAATRYSLPH
jgi:hypothetical protein